MNRRLTPQTLRRLSYFAVVADAGSIREAARRLSISVASISEALTALEEDLETTLAVRSTRRFQLTEEGRRVAGVAERVLDAGEALYANQGGAQDLVGQVALTAPVEVAQSWLPEKLQIFRNSHPKVGVSVSASDHLLDLAMTPFDIGIRARYVAPGDPDAVGVMLPLTCVSAAPLEVVKRENGWFAPTTLISHRPGGYLDVLEHKAANPRKLRFADEMIVDNKHVALAMVARGMGAALVSRNSLRLISGLQEFAPEFSFGHIGLQFEMRDARPSKAALALQKVLSTDT